MVINQNLRCNACSLVGQLFSGVSENSGKARIFFTLAAIIVAISRLSLCCLNQIKSINVKSDKEL